MKKSTLNSFLFITGIVPLIAVLLCLHLLPDEIPAHYDMNMNIDRWGSKYETLILPVFTLIETVFLYIAAKRCGRRENGESTKKVTLITGITSNLLFAAITAVMLAGAFDSVNINEVTQGFSMNIIFVITGIAVAVSGNYLPKCKLNSCIGLRTEWSMANEDVWFKCQRFGGVLLVVCGIVMAVFSAAVENSAAVIAGNLFIMIFMTAASVAGSKIIYDKMYGGQNH